MKNSKLYLSLIILLLLLSGCGGGTIGTGSQERVYTLTGIISDSDGQPLEGIEVSTETSHNSSLTDEQGKFLIESETNSDNQIIFILKNDSFYAEAALEISDTQQTSIPVIIEVDQTSGIVTSVTIKNLSENPAGEENYDNDPITQSYSGKFIGSTGKGIAGVKVTEDRFKISDLSEKDGRFEIKTTNGGGKVKFRVRYKGLNGSFVINNVATDKNVKLEFSVKLSIEEALIDPDKGETERRLTVELVR